MLDPDLVWSGFTGVPPGFRRAMLTEYLQYKALGFIYGTGASRGLVFMGARPCESFTAQGGFRKTLTSIPVSFLPGMCWR